jgi:hypothetical protein
MLDKLKGLSDTGIIFNRDENHRDCYFSVFYHLFHKPNKDIVVVMKLSLIGSFDHSNEVS